MSRAALRVVAPPPRTISTSPVTRTSGIEKVSLYIRVAHSLRSRIHQGEWSAEHQLPTIGELAREYGVALITVRQALQLLSREGLVASTRGRGTFVCAGVTPLAQSPGLRAAINDRLDMPANASIRVLSRTFTSELPAHFVPAGAGQYPGYAIVEKVHVLEDEPISYMKVMVARQIYEKFPRGADKRDKILKLILAQGRLKLRRSHLELIVTYADDAMAAALQCAPLSALVRIRTSRIDTKGKVVLCHDSYYRGDRFVYEVEEEGVELGRSSGVVLPATKVRGKK